jgi:hypothetical protein
MEPKRWGPNVGRVLCLAGIVACGFTADYFHTRGVNTAMVVVGFVLLVWIASSTIPKGVS